MRNNKLWNRILDHVLVGGLTLVILGLVSVQLLGVVGMAGVFGRDDESPTTLDLQSRSGIVAPVLCADLGGDRAEANPKGLRASLWLAPIASLRGGFGLGWLERVDSELGLPDGEHHELRLRLGGGLMAPLTPSMGVDLHAGA
jgi:hypothetical protein